MLTIEQTRLNKKTQGRGFHRLARPLASAFAAFGGVFSATAVACLCSTAEVTPVEYDEVFSGLVISTERIDEPVAGATVPGEDVVEAPGYWSKSTILVLRTWRGAPSTVAEVWTPVVSNCDSPPIAGFYFVALVRSEKARDVASNSLCDDALKAAATQERGVFTVAGIITIAGAIGATVVAFLSLVKVIRRKRKR